MKRLLAIAALALLLQFLMGPLLADTSCTPPQESRDRS